MKRLPHAAIARRAAEIAVCGGILVAAAFGASGCATGASAAGGSTVRSASIYRSASATVQLAPDQAFNPAVKILLERGDIEITDLKEHDNRCRAVAGDRKLTFKVVDNGTGRSRLSMVVGGGNDPEANQELADNLMRAICDRLPVSCESGPSTS